MNRTLAVLGKLAQLAVQVNSQPATADVVFGIETLNEPATVYQLGPITFEVLLSFYERVRLGSGGEGGGRRRGTSWS